MKRQGFSIKFLAWTLAVGLLLLLGTTTGSAFAHDIQHAGHHSAGMHSQGICAWMCAAGTALDGIGPSLDPQGRSVESIIPASPQAPALSLPSTSESRAPPRHSHSA